MFQYAIPPVTEANRTNRSRWISPVEKTTEVKPVRPVEPGQVGQQSSYRRTQSVEAQSAPRSYQQVLRGVQQAGEKAQTATQPRTHGVSHIRSAPEMLSIRSTKTEISPDYIRRRLEQLGNMKREGIQSAP